MEELVVLYHKVNNNSQKTKQKVECAMQLLWANMKSKQQQKEQLEQFSLQPEREKNDFSDLCDG